MSRLHTCFAILLPTLVPAFLLLASTNSAAAQAGWDWPVDHPLTLRDPNFLTRNTQFTPDALAWTGQTRVLAVQPLAANIDASVTTDDGTTWISQDPDPEAIEFFVFDENPLGNDDRARPECTATIYSNGSDPATAYVQYDQARDFEVWDGQQGYTDIQLQYFELLAVRRIYLRAGVSYRFHVDLADRHQEGFAALMRSDENSRIQPRANAVGEFRWGNDGQEEWSIAPEEGWYTLVVVQTNGQAIGLGTVKNTIVFGRGEQNVETNNIRISVRAG